MSDGRIVLVTGGSRGIGLACAERFAALGDRVAVTYNSSPPPEGLFGVKCDVTSADDVDAAFAAVEEEFGGPVEVLVSNAGATRDGLLLRMSEDDFASVLDTNLTASFRVAKRAARGMLKARSGRIILMSSVVGLLGSGGQSNYAAAKAGILGLTRALAREVVTRGIRVNALAPGFIDTELTAPIQAARPFIEAATPMGRFGEPDELVGAAVWLASDASRFVTGAVIPVDGGFSAFSGV